MQLPRGTFREIRKAVVLESLLKELNGEKFSGVASISSHSLAGSLVFRGGTCILVKVRNSRGDAGLEELLKAKSEVVDAALSLLDDAQVDLALEFNKSFRLTKFGKPVTTPSLQRSAPPAFREPSRAAPAQRPVILKPAAPVAPLKHPAKPAPSRHQVPAPPVPPQTPVHNPAPNPFPFFKAAAQTPLPPPVPDLYEDKKKTEADEQPQPEQETSSLDHDFETFDTMDFETVTDKIRADCKTMIKQLQLDHLMER
jgi:hypothetical protein